MVPFDIREVRELIEDDGLELEKLGDRKTALFAIVSDTDSTTLFRTKETKDQKTSIVEMCITGYGINNSVCSTWKS